MTFFAFVTAFFADTVVVVVIDWTSAIRRIDSNSRTGDTNLIVGAGGTSSMTRRAFSKTIIVITINTITSWWIDSLGIWSTFNTFCKVRTCQTFFMTVSAYAFGIWIGSIWAVTAWWIGSAGATG